MMLSSSVNNKINTECFICCITSARDTIKDGAPTSRYVVRVLNPQTVRRALIKGFTGRITDISFAHRHSNTLACVDEAGNLFIWEILEEDDKVVYLSSITNRLIETHLVN